MPLADRLDLPARATAALVFAIVVTLSGGTGARGNSDVEQRIAAFWDRINALQPTDFVSSGDLGQWALNVIARDSAARLTMADFRASTATMQGAIDRARTSTPAPASATVEQRIAAFWDRINALAPSDFVSSGDLGQWALNVTERDTTARLTVTDFRVSTAGMQEAMDRAGRAPTVPANSPTPTPMPTSSPTPRAAPNPPSSVTFRISAGIAQRDVDAVRDGVGRASRFFTEVMGSDPVTRATVIVTTYNSPDWPTDTGNTCCGMPNIQQPLIAYAVDHRFWISGASAEGASWYPWTQRTGVHEYGHVWQTAAGCRVNYHTAPPDMPMWLVEGGIEWLAFEAMIRDGLISRAWAFWYVALQNTNRDQAPPSLRDMERAGAYNQWSYQYGAFASFYLLDRRGLASYGRFCNEMRTGVMWQTAFQRAFGLSADQFYADFEQWRLQHTTRQPQPVFAP